MGSTFTVTSDRLAGHKRGDVVDSDKLGAANVLALVAAGHLKAADEPKKAKGSE